MDQTVQQARKLYHVADTTSTASDNTIITWAAPDGDTAKRIHVQRLEIQNVAGTSNTVYLKSSGASGQISLSVLLGANGGAWRESIDPEKGSVYWTDADANLVLNLSAATAINYDITYYYDQRPIA